MSPVTTPRTRRDPKAPVRTTQPKRQPTDKEKAQWAKAREEKIEALREDLNTQVLALMNDPERWTDFLDTVSDFAAGYSFTNMLLIWTQALEKGFQPVMVRPFGRKDGSSGWLKLGRQVRKGETGLRIFRPNFRRYTEADLALMREIQPKKAAAISAQRTADGKLPLRLMGFKVESVFDISQTDGDDVTLPKTITIRRRIKTADMQPELLTGEDTTGTLESVIALIEAKGYTFSYVPTKAVIGGANGRTTWAVKTVQVRDDVDDAQKLKTTIHELGHILCGHEHPEDEYAAHQGVKETEAESVAYIVAGALGMSTVQYSAPYVAGWLEGDPEEAAKAFIETGKRIVTAAKEILDALIPDEPQADEEAGGE